MNLAKIKKQIEKDTPEIRFKGLKKLTARSEGLETFIDKILKEYSRDLDTINVDTRGIVSPSGRTRRSLNEIYRLCKYYFPNCELTDVITILFSKLTSNTKGYRYTFCYANERKMFYYRKGSNCYMENTVDQFNNNNAFYESVINS